MNMQKEQQSDVSPYSALAVGVIIAVLAGGGAAATISLGMTAGPLVEKSIAAAVVAGTFAVLLTMVSAASQGEVPPP